MASFFNYISLTMHLVIMAKRTLNCKIVQAVLKLRNQEVSGILAAGVGLKPVSQYDVRTMQSKDVS